MSRYVFQHHIRSSISRGIYTSRGTLATPPALLRCPAHKTLPRRYPPRLARCLPVKWSGGRNWLFPVKIFKYRNIFLCWLLLSTAHWNTSLRGGTNLISLNYNNTGEIFLKMRAEKWHNKLAKTCFKNHTQRFGLVQLTMLFNTYNFKACSGPRASDVSSTSTLFF